MMLMFSSLHKINPDFSATYIMKGGKYNFSFEVKNITNEELADNFGMLKPGRAFYGKIRVYFMQRRKHHNIGSTKIMR